MKEQLSSAAPEKRKRMEEETQDEAVHKKLSSDHSISSLDSEEVVGEYLPSDAETGIDNLEIIDNSSGAEGNEVNTIQVANGSTNTATDSLVDLMEDKVTNRDKSDVLKQIDDFESLIKNKRLQESGSGDNIIKGDVTEATGSDREGKFNTNSEGQSKREIIGDSDESLHSTNSKGDGVKNAMSDHSYAVNKNSAGHDYKAGSEKPGLILKDIDSLIFSPVGHDIIVPSFSNTCSDPVMDITEAVEDDTRQNREKVERELKFKVGQFVSTVLNSFYKKENGVETKEEFSKVASEFTNQFVEEIKDSFRWSHDGSLDGLTMTKDDKLSITDQIYLHFNVKVAVKKHLAAYKKTISPGSLEKNIKTLTAKLSNEIKESYKMIHNTLSGVSVTEDVKLMIKNKIDTQFS